MGTSVDTARPVGELVRDWRRRRGVSQLGLALKADISARHLSFVESGRSQPSREMVLRLAEHLEVPLRQRNDLLLAAGYAPAFRERPLDHPALASARQAIDRLLAGHEPYPALAVDRHWNLVASNRAVAPLLAGVAPALLQPPVNVMRLALHPEGLAPRILNFPEWRAHVFHRLRHQIEVTGDPVLVHLQDELHGYAAPRAREVSVNTGDSAVLVPLRLATAAGALSLISTTVVFGTPLDVTLSELALETFFPANEASAAVLRRIAADSGSSVRDR
jgi:transcriptional regulator with XRE-family HTH domain